MIYTEEDIKRAYQLGYQHGAAEVQPLNNDEVLVAMKLLKTEKEE